MNFLFLCNKVPYPARDGGAIATFEMATAIAEAGHNVTILAMSTLKHHVDIESIPVEIQEKLHINLVDVPARISFDGLIRNFLLSKNPYIADRFISEKFRNRLSEILTSGSFDFVQLEGLYLSAYISTVREYSNAKIIYRAHNIEHEIWQRSLDFAKGLRKLYLMHMVRRLVIYEKKVLNKYDLLVPITRRDELHLKEMGDFKPSFVFPFSIHESRIDESNVVAEASSLFFIGSLDWTPNIDGLKWFVKKCWPQILSMNPNTTFYVAGRNASPDLVRELSKTQIYYLGEIEDARDYMREKSIMISPLFSGSGMRVKIVEAMSLGKPVVTTSIGAEGINAIHNKEIMIANDSAEFTKSVLMKLRDDDRRGKMAQSAVGFIRENFVIEKLAC